MKTIEEIVTVTYMKVTHEQDETRNTLRKSHVSTYSTQDTIPQTEDSLYFLDTCRPRGSCSSVCYGPLICASFFRRWISLGPSEGPSSPLTRVSILDRTTQVRLTSLRSVSLPTLVSVPSPLYEPQTFIYTNKYSHIFNIYP